MIIGKISKGSNMDQVYLSKDREKGFEVGSYVMLQKVKSNSLKPYYFNVENLEPIKTQIIEEIFGFLGTCENVFVVGSFLEQGFNFEDLDLIVIGDSRGIQEFVKINFGLSVHVITFEEEKLIKAINSEPLFQLMLSRFVSKKRFVFEINNEINYKILDLALLESKLLFEENELSGNKIYKLLKNLIAVKRFVENKALTKKFVDEDIEKHFFKGFLLKLKVNILPKDFRKICKNLYEEIFDQIMPGIKKLKKITKVNNRKSK